MTQNALSLATVYQGWATYQQEIVRAIAPLTDEQLDLRTAPHLRTIREIASHIIGARSRWISEVLKEGDADFAALGIWDRADQPARAASELAQALESSWHVIQTLLERWTTNDLADLFTGTYGEEPYSLSLQWVLWHLIEHDLHHGGEISLTLGAHGLSAVIQH